MGLSAIMIPPLMSSTLNGEDLGLSGKGKENAEKVDAKQPVDKKDAGRPEKADSEKSEKTIANKEALG